MRSFVPFQIVHPESRELQDPNRSSRKFGPVAVAPNGGATSETTTRPMSRPTRRTGSRATRFFVPIPPTHQEDRNPPGGYMSVPERIPVRRGEWRFGGRRASRRRHFYFFIALFS